MTRKKLTFEWDLGNTLHLWEKHQVRPFEAEQAMTDSNAILGSDEVHSNMELRFTVLGKTRKHRILFLAFTIRNKHIRILHARNVKRKEAKIYEETIQNTKV